MGTLTIGAVSLMLVAHSKNRRLRSDHAPFWEAGIASLMWTDTSEFRNPHYHRNSDTPDTLDYGFLSNVTQLALARAVSRAENL